MMPLAVAVAVDSAPLREDRRRVIASPQRGAAADVAPGWPADRVSLSRGQEGEAAAAEGEPDVREPAGEGELDEAELVELRRLQQRDARVRAHESAHQAAAGGFGGGASFTYETGPDGKRYAVRGTVPIRLVSGRTLEETIANARQVRAAALAPSDPSAQDLAVAASASAMEAAARAQQARRAAAAYGSH